MNHNVFLQGWIVGSRLRAHKSYSVAAGAGGGSGKYDKASFLAGMAAGFACRGAPMWGLERPYIIADHEYLLPLGAGIPVALDAVDIGKVEYLLPLGAGLPVEMGDVETGRGEYLLPLGAGIPATINGVDAGNAECLLPLGAGRTVAYQEGT